MKLASTFVAVALANVHKKFWEKKPDKSGVSKLRSVESCQVSFDRSDHAELEVVNLGTSGHIAIDQYDNNVQCFIQVNAADTVACQEITAEIVSASVEYSDGCVYDKFWFDAESDHDPTDGGVCGCGGTNTQPALEEGCNSALYSYNLGASATHFSGNWGNRVFAKNNFVFNLNTDYSVKGGNVRIKWECTNQATTAVEYLDQMLQLSIRFLENTFASHKQQATNGWIRKFTRNAHRMKDAFDRCGTDTPSSYSEWFTHANTNPEQAIVDITTGFQNWSDANLANCNGQKNFNHQQRRRVKWERNLKRLYSRL